MRRGDEPPQGCVTFLNLYISSRVLSTQDWLSQCFLKKWTSKGTNAFG